MKGVINDRFHSNLMDVHISAKYDLVISRWGLCYLVDEHVEPYLKRCYLDLTLGRPGAEPCPMIFYETVHDSRRHENTREGQ